MNVELPFLVGDIYLVERKLSQGSFGTVYSGTNLQTKTNIAIKIEKDTDNSMKSYTNKEILILQRLFHLKGIPELIWYSDNMIIISLLGKDLSSYLKIFKKFSQKTIMMLTLQLVNILESIHKRGVLHRDLKPENILVGRGEDSREIYLIDFGISKIVDDLKDLTYKENKSFVGTARYASVAAHKGCEMNGKDDLESLFYVMVFCAKGFLPWQKINASEEEKLLRVGKIKEELTVEEICSGMPVQFKKAFTYIRNLKFEEPVDYDYLRKLIDAFAEEMQIELDNVFDWISSFQTEKKPIKKKVIKTPSKDEKMKIHKTKTNACEEKEATDKYFSQNSLNTNTANRVTTIEGFKKFQHNNTSRFQKINNDLLTIPNSESLMQFSESSINLSSRCSSMRIKYDISQDSCGNIINFKKINGIRQGFTRILW